MQETAGQSTAVLDGKAETIAEVWQAYNHGLKFLIADASSNRLNLCCNVLNHLKRNRTWAGLTFAIAIVDG